MRFCRCEAKRAYLAEQVESQAPAILCGSGLTLVSALRRRTQGETSSACMPSGPTYDNYSRI